MLDSEWETVRWKEAKTHGPPAVVFLLGMLELIMAEIEWEMPEVG